MGDRLMMILQWMMLSVAEMRQTFLLVSLRVSTIVVVMRGRVSGVNKNQATITMDQQPQQDMRLQHHGMIIGLQLLVDNALDGVFTLTQLFCGQGSTEKTVQALILLSAIPHCYKKHVVHTVQSGVFAADRAK